MNESKSKQQIALEAGFSPSTARVPKLIENKIGFKLAKAELADQAGNVALKVLSELQVRDLSKMTNSELTATLETITRVCQRLAPLAPQKI